MNRICRLHGTSLRYQLEGGTGWCDDCQAWVDGKKHARKMSSADVLILKVSGVDAPTEEMEE